MGHVRAPTGRGRPRPRWGRRRVRLGRERATALQPSLPEPRAARPEDPPASPPRARAPMNARTDPLPAGMTTVTAHANTGKGPRHAARVRDVPATGRRRSPAAADGARADLPRPPTDPASRAARRRARRRRPALPPHRAHRCRAAVARAEAARGRELRRRLQQRRPRRGGGARASSSPTRPTC